MLDIVAYSAICTLVLVFILFVSKFNKFGITYKLFTIYAGLISICEWSCAYYLEVLKANNRFITHADTLIQFGMFSAIFYLLFKSKLQKVFALVCGVVVIFYFLSFYYFNQQEIYEENNLQTFITSLILVIYCTIHLYNMLNQQKREFYYITVGLLIYLVGSALIQCTSTIIASLNDNEIYSNIWVFNCLFYLTYQIFCIIEWKKNYYKAI